MTTMIGQNGEMINAPYDSTFMDLLPPSGSIWNNGVAPPDATWVDMGGPLYPYWDGDLFTSPNVGGLSNPNAPIRTSIAGVEPSTMVLLVGVAILAWVLFKR